MKSSDDSLLVIATDLDGTILPYGGKYHPGDLQSLHHLGEMGVIRIIATGRSLWSARMVLDLDFPVDYLVFSSGAGIFSWKEQRLLHHLSIPFNDVVAAMELLKLHNLAFTLHQKSPNNHHFFYYEGTNPHNNLHDFLLHYYPNGNPMAAVIEPADYSQIVAFMHNAEQFDEISSLFSNLKTIRATSPIDNESIWLECFNPNVSKAAGIRFICNLLGISTNRVGVIGNDYNDLDMLNGFQHSGVVSNAPDYLTNRFSVVPSVHQAGFSHFVSSHHFGS